MIEAPRSPIDVAAAVLGPLARRDEPLGARTTYRVGGTAAIFVEIADEAEIATLVDAIATSGARTLVVGNGSNLLVADGGFDGIVVTLGEHFRTVVVAEDQRSVTAGGATPLPVLARTTAAAGLTGLEWAVGVPGTVGGAVRMNAGGHGADTADRLLWARVVDLELGRDRIVDAAGLSLSYRHSSLSPTDLVVEARFRVDPGTRARSEAEIAEIVTWRREHQPGGRNGGSVFANPEGEPAGRLIDRSGLKGLRIGSAYVSEKHANFIGVDAGGSANDVRQVIDEVRRVVAERTGVALRVELECVGFPS
jgi:UDP-N-acetylmuramate dehydrogenase